LFGMSLKRRCSSSICEAAAAAPQLRRTASGLAASWEPLQGPHQAGAGRSAGRPSPRPCPLPLSPPAAHPRAVHERLDKARQHLVQVLVRLRLAARQLDAERHAQREAGGGRLGCLRGAVWRRWWWWWWGWGVWGVGRGAVSFGALRWAVLLLAGRCGAGVPAGSNREAAPRPAGALPRQLHRLHRRRWPGRSRERGSTWPRPWSSHTRTCTHMRARTHSQQPPPAPPGCRSA
jgi:hypothetical protein